MTDYISMDERATLIKSAKLMVTLPWGSEEQIDQEMIFYGLAEKKGIDLESEEWSKLSMFLLKATHLEAVKAVLPHLGIHLADVIFKIWEMEDTNVEA